MHGLAHGPHWWVGCVFMVVLVTVLVAPMAIAVARGAFADEE